MRKYKKGIIYYLIFSVLLLVLLGAVRDTNNISAKKIDNYANTPIAFGKTREPALLPGMTAIYWDNGEEKELKGPFLEKEKWYDYNEKRWANAKTKDGSYWVWIPAFAYRVAYYNDAEKTDLKGYRIQNDYVDKNYKPVKFPEDVISKNMKVEIKYILEDGSDIPEGYTVHPAFFKDKVMGNGFWIAKYKATGDIKSPEFKKSNTKLTNVSIDQAFSKLDASSLEGNSYGFTDEFVKVGLPRNNELGAIYYLTQSIAGIGKDTISYIGDKEESSTGNITGVYDLNDGIREWTSAYISNSSTSIDENGKSLKTTNTEKVGTKDIDILSKIETYPFKTYAQEYMDNIKELERNRFINYGDGIYETTVPISDKNSALGNGISDYPYGDNVFITRGSEKTDKNKSMFSFRGDTGKANENVGFRASAYIFPKVRDNNVRITLKTDQGIIYDTKTNQEIGKEMYITITKGAIPENRYIVKSLPDNVCFEGWSIPLGGVPVYEDMTIKAQFAAVSEPPSMEKFKVVFKDSLTSEIYYDKEVIQDTEIKQIADRIHPKKEGYTFVGWDNDVNVKANKDMTFTALWKKDEIKKYTVKFLDDFNGKVYYQTEVAENSIAQEPKERPKKEGYTFIAWSPDVSKTIIRSDTIFTPIFEKQGGVTPDDEMVEIMFISDPGYINGIKNSERYRIKKGTSLMMNPTVRKSLESLTVAAIDYEFVGWDIEYDTRIRENKIVKAKWRRKTYTYEFVDMNEKTGTINRIYDKGTFKSGESLEGYAPKNPKKTGHKFLGWTPAFSEHQRGNIVYKAVWKNLMPDSTTIGKKELKIVFDPNGGTLKSKSTYMVREGYSLPNVLDPVRPGFIFVGWEGVSKQDPNGPQMRNETYLAKWKMARDYTVKDQPRGGYTTGSSSNNPGSTRLGDNGARMFTTRNGQLIPINPDGSYQNQGNVELQNNNNSNGKNNGIVNKKREEDYPKSGIKENIALIALSIIVPLIGIYMVVNWIRLRDIDKESKKK